MKSSTNATKREFVLLAISLGSFQASRLGVSLFAANAVGPESYGVWNAIQPLLTYSVLMTAGTVSGMNREVPFLLGSDDERGAELLVTTTFLFGLMMSVLAGAALGFVAFVLPEQSSYRSSLLVAAPLLPIWTCFFFSTNRFQSELRYRDLAMYQLAFAVLFPLATVPATRAAGLEGFIGAHAAVMLLLILAWSKIAPLTPPRGLTGLGKLVREGFPIMLVGLVHSMLITADRWVIATQIGTEALGHYTLAILAYGAIMMLPAIISRQYYPRMSFEFGRSGSVAPLGRMATRMSLAAVAVSASVAGVAYLCLPLVAELLVPAYAPGIPAANVLLIGIAVSPIGAGSATILIILGKQWQYLLLTVIALILNLAADFAFLSAGFGLVGVAAAAALAYAALAAMTIGAAAYHMRRSPA